MLIFKVNRALKVLITDLKDSPEYRFVREVIEAMCILFYRHTMVSIAFRICHLFRVFQFAYT